MGRGKRSQLPLSDAGRERVLPRLRRGPDAPSDVEVLQTAVAYAELENRGDETLEDDLRRLGLEPEQTHYRLLRLPARDLESAMCALDDYLSDGDEDGYQQAEGMLDTLRAGGTLPPVIVVYGDDYSSWSGYGESLGRWVVLDGWHRLAAHGEAESAVIDAYQLLPRG